MCLKLEQTGLQKTSNCAPKKRCIERRSKASLEEQNKSVQMLESRLDQPNRWREFVEKPPIEVTP